MTDLAAAIFFGNALTLLFVWGCVQFHKHDYEAPWAAYGAFLFPILYFLSVVYTTEGLPQPLAALASQ